MQSPGNRALLPAGFALWLSVPPAAIPGRQNEVPSVLSYCLFEWPRPENISGRGRDSSQAASFHVTNPHPRAPTTLLNIHGNNGTL